MCSIGKMEGFFDKNFHTSNCFTPPLGGERVMIALAKVGGEGEGSQVLLVMPSRYSKNIYSLWGFHVWHIRIFMYIVWFLSVEWSYASFCSENRKNKNQAKRHDTCISRVDLAAFQVFCISEHWTTIRDSFFRANVSKYSTNRCGFPWVWFPLCLLPPMCPHLVSPPGAMARFVLVGRVPSTPGVLFTFFLHIPHVSSDNLTCWRWRGNRITGAARNVE